MAAHEGRKGASGAGTGGAARGVGVARGCWRGGPTGRPSGSSTTSRCSPSPRPLRATSPHSRRFRVSGAIRRSAAGERSSPRCVGGSSCRRISCPGSCGRLDGNPIWRSKPGWSGSKIRRNALALELDLAPGVLCPNGILEAIARANPGSVEQLQAVPELRRWQARVIGPSLFEALQEAQPAAG